jgi:capsular exopolysaccharide synthesis family protein
MDKEYFQQQSYLTDYARVIKRRLHIVIIFFSTVVLVVAAISFLIKPVYRATVTLLIDVENPNVLTASGIVAIGSQNYYTYKEYCQSQEIIIKSRLIARHVFNEFNLRSSKEYAKEKDPIEAFLKNISVELVRATRLLRLSVDNQDPVLATQMANRIAEIYVKRNLYYNSRDEIMNLFKNEYLKLKTRHSENSNTYKNKHPKMLRLKKEIEELIERIENIKNSTFDFDLIDQKGDTRPTYLLEGLKANNVSIEDPAVVPVYPIKPKKRLNVLLAAIVGLFGGLSLAFFFEYLDDGIKSTQEATKLTGWPFLGGIPKIGTNKALSEFKKDMITYVKPDDPASEAYKAVRTGIFFSSTEERPSRSILITSASPQEGKTTNLCNLGIVIAQSKKRVLLVDADMRKPRLHGIFKVKNDNGLSTYLLGKTDFEDVIRKTQVDGVSLITSGPYTPNPSELLSGHMMEEFITSAKAKFDYILFDTPPVAVVTDPVVLSRIVDGVVFVVESGKTSARMLSRVRHTMDDANIRMIGVVVNRISPKTDGYHYYYHSQYYSNR